MFGALPIHCDLHLAARFFSPLGPSPSKFIFQLAQGQMSYTAACHPLTCTTLVGTVNLWSYENQRFSGPSDHGPCRRRTLAMGGCGISLGRFFHFVVFANQNLIRLRSLRWKNKPKHYSGWFVVREKYYSDWKNKLKSTDYKRSEQAKWCSRVQLADGCSIKLDNDLQ